MPISYPTPKLFEAIMKDTEFKSTLPDILGKAKTNLMVNAVMREAILSDAAGALGKMHDVVIEATKPTLLLCSIQCVWMSYLRKSTRPRR